MKLLEILDSKVPYRVDFATSTKFQASAEINGREIVFLGTEIGPWPSSGEEVWNVEFSETDDTKNNGGRTFKLTGSGGEFKVFSMVKSALRELIERYKPGVIMFSSDKEGARASLYRKIIVKPLESEYAAQETDQGQKISFLLRRR